MPRDEPSGILDTEMTLQSALEQVTGLADATDQCRKAPGPRRRRPDAECRRGDKTDRDRGGQSPKRPGPGFAGRYRWRETRATEGAADQISADITRPNHQQQHDNNGTTT